LMESRRLLPTTTAILNVVMGGPIQEARRRFDGAAEAR